MYADVYNITITGDRHNFMVGENTSLSCGISGNVTLRSRTLYYVWSRNGVVIAQENNFSLPLKELTLDNDGNYTCEVISSEDCVYRTSEDYIISVTGEVATLMGVCLMLWCT